MGQEAEALLSPRIAPLTSTPLKSGHFRWCHVDGRRKSGCLLETGPPWIEGSRGEPGGSSGCSPAPAPAPGGRRLLQSRLPSAEEWAVPPGVGGGGARARLGRAESGRGMAVDVAAPGWGIERAVTIILPTPAFPAMCPPGCTQDTDLMGFSFLPCTPGSAQTWVFLVFLEVLPTLKLFHILKCEVNIF